MQTRHTDKLIWVQSGDLVMSLQRRGCDQHVMGTNDLALHFQSSPQPRVLTSNGHVKLDDRNHPQHILHKSGSFCPSLWSVGPFDTMQEFRCRDRSDEKRFLHMRPKEPRQIELSAFSGDENRAVQDQSHREIGDESLPRAESRSCSNEAASSSPRCFIPVHASARTPPFARRPATGTRRTTGRPSSLSTASSSPAQTRRTRSKKCREASVTDKEIMMVKATSPHARRQAWIDRQMVHVSPVHGTSLQP